MAKKKNTFFDNFWRETGTNTGKWASNKIFGNTGWATPRRHIFDSDEAGKAAKKIRSSSKASERSEKEELSEPSSKELMTKELMDLAASIDFNTNSVDDISFKLDDLLVGAEKGFDVDLSPQIFKVKIRAGIQRLRWLNETTRADFYQQELERIEGKVKRKRFLNVLLIAAALLGMLLFMLIASS